MCGITALKIDTDGTMQPVRITGDTIEQQIAEMLRKRKACGTETISIDEAIEQVRNAAS